MRWIFLLPFLLLMSCFSHQSYMTRDRFDEIVVGTSADHVKQIAGEPMEIITISPTDVEYLYVEKINMGTKVTSENQYRILISNGKVISKKVTIVTPPSYNLIYQNEADANQT